MTTEMDHREFDRLASLLGFERFNELRGAVESWTRTLGGTSVSGNRIGGALDPKSIRWDDLDGLPELLVYKTDRDGRPYVDPETNKAAVEWVSSPLPLPPKIREFFREVTQ